ncbi:hypothetical protein Tco_0683498 [Tanacetum coccineum]|uniref:Uncharacterized protein n=1 Tax=Tanacetum coccineum TaxID=301880 RepID=A0ABQ4XVL4_9ASTR
MDDPNITMEEYIRLEEEKARRRAIVFNETLTSEAALSCEPMVCSLNNDKIDFRISFGESDYEDCTSIEDEEVSLVDGVLEGALGALGLVDAHGCDNWLMNDDEYGFLLSYVVLEMII